MLLDDYIERHISPEPEYLHRIDRLSHLRRVHGRMCSGHAQGRLLVMLTAMIRPSNILELGTFTGYATLCLAEGAPDAHIDTVEVFDENETLIRRAFDDSEYGVNITLHIDDAIRYMSTRPDGAYDLILIDADKRQYPDYLDEALRILAPGGYILADNTLWGGKVLDTHPHTDPQTAGIIRFNDLVARNPDLEKVILPLRDGLTIIRKIKKSTKPRSHTL
ncbi:MAG: O-methyltransferase [Muribaculaceae bacterium]|nr:O-methyltransferase [Muribaculaceae bacterium]